MLPKGSKVRGIFTIGKLSTDLGNSFNEMRVPDFEDKVEV